MRAPITKQVKFVLARGIWGITEASATGWHLKELEAKFADVAISKAESSHLD